MSCDSKTIAHTQTAAAALALLLFSLSIGRSNVLRVYFDSDFYRRTLLKASLLCILIRKSILVTNLSVQIISIFSGDLRLFRLLGEKRPYDLFDCGQSNARFCGGKPRLSGILLFGRVRGGSAGTACCSVIPRRLCFGGFGLGRRRKNVATLQCKSSASNYLCVRDVVSMVPCTEQSNFGRGGVRWSGQG